MENLKRKNYYHEDNNRVESTLKVKFDNMKEKYKLLPDFKILK